MPKQDDEIETADYKTTSSGRKVRAHRIVFNKGEEDQDKLREESMTDEQKSERERIVKGMKKNYKGFVAKYGKDRAKSVMYATATKNAMKEESEIEEELKGNQHKLDKNKNGKLDKQDFKLLRKEESEQLDELSKTTLGSYYNAAKQDNRDHADSRRSGDKDEAKWAKDRMVKRSTGMVAAKQRLNKEESEQLDELSKDTLKKYKDHAPWSQIRHASDVYDHENEGRSGAKAPASSYRNLANRKKGIARADARLNKEEFDHEALDKKYGKPRDATDQEKKGGGTSSKSHSLIGGKIYHWQDPRGRAAHAALKKEEVELDEAHPFDIPKSSGMATSTATKHDVKKTSTGTVYTKQRDADGMAKEFKRDPDEAKRGRGRPKKNSFSEAAEFLMSLDEEMFDELMAEGFDAFAEEFEKLDELSKTTLGNYIKKAANDKADTAFHRGYSAYNNSRHKPYSEPMANKVHRGQENRNKGIKRAVTRLTK